MERPLWIPSPERVACANLTRFGRSVADRFGVPAAGYRDLYAWSIAAPADFWAAVWEFTGIASEGPRGRPVDHLDRMPDARFFPEARLNFAANLLRQESDGDAIVFGNEQGSRRTLSWPELRGQVGLMAASFLAHGIQPGDRIAGYLPNIPEGVIAALAAAAVGAVWSSCSPDFGVQGLIDRFGQIGPRLLVTADGYRYAGKPFDSLVRIGEALARLPSIERTIVVPYLAPRPGLDGVRHGILWSEFLRGARPLAGFAALPFSHPLYILYSSGTTGAPKCIVHGAGGTLIQHLKEHQLHCDIRPGDRVFYYSTLGWMMWNWLVTALASGATIVLYDGSPVHPEPEALFSFADETGMTLFGTSAKYIDAVAKAGLQPRRTHSLATLRTITSTGSPLSPESFEYVYREVKRDVHLASISGGTDIISCFVLGNPTGPVWRGEIQARGLGMQVEVFDAGGHPVRGEKGELVCAAPFPSMPVGFWNDPEGRKYHAAYFERFPGVWTHGDYVELTPHDGVIIYGRSDAVLNPGGVRIGTAEIYRQVEQIPEVLESLVIGQHLDHDERIVLFVKLAPGTPLSQPLADRIRAQIRTNTTPRHVPAVILAVEDIPRTKSGKIVELAVRDVVHGRPVLNRDALANPEALAYFTNRPELRT